MTFPDGYSVRRPRRDDLTDWVRVCAAVDLAETGAVDYDEPLVLEEWERPRFELERDGWVVVGPDGEVVAHCSAWEAAPGERVLVDSYALPDLAAELEEPLLDLALAEATRVARDSGGESVTIHVPNAAAATTRARLIQARGLELVRHFLRMRVDLAAVSAPRAAPAPGVSLRAYDPSRDERTVHGLHTTSFAEHWGSRQEPFEEWRAEVVETPAYDPTLWSVAELDGKPAGFVMGREGTAGNGWVRTLGVVPTARGRGMGEALLRRTFDLFRDRGWPVAELSVDAENRTGATRLYERAGMHVAFALEIWEQRIEV